MDVHKPHKATCHCGAVEFSVLLPMGLNAPCRCDCSLCRRRGTVVVDVDLPNLSVIKGTDALTLYQFNTNTARHYFCKFCGIHTHHQRRSNPNQYSVNVGCLEGINPLQLGPIITFDGVNHPSDSISREYK
jgi:hypothetical protein